MNIWELDKLTIFIIFVIPGFISLKTYETLNPFQSKDSSQQVIDAITYSSINYAVLLVPLYYLEIPNTKNNFSIFHILLYFFTLFIFPVIIALFWNWVRRQDFVQSKIPHPVQKPWDWVFSKRKSYWVKVTMKDGEVVGGLYAEDSFTSSAPAEEQIYLQESWKINEKKGFEEAKTRTQGIIVLASEIKYLELTQYKESS